MNSKNIFFLAVAFLLLLGSGYNAKANPQEQDKDSVLFIIFATDAVGNTDSIFIKASKNVPELSSINLYGIEPERDLDLRFITRTHKNCEDYWLCGHKDSSWNYMEYWGWCVPSSENVDVKVAYLNAPERFCFYPDQFVFKVHAKHFPVKVGMFINKGFWYELSFYAMRDVLELTFHNETDGSLISYGPYSFPKRFEWSKLDPSLFEGIFWNIPILIDSLFFIVNEEGTKNVMFFYWRYIDNIFENDKIQTLYPNPSLNTIVLENSSIDEKYEIISMDGFVIKNGVINNEDAIIDISNLSAGSYYIRTKKYFYKLIKTEK